MWSKFNVLSILLILLVFSMIGSHVLADEPEIIDVVGGDTVVATTPIEATPQATAESFDEVGLQSLNESLEIQAVNHVVNRYFELQNNARSTQSTLNLSEVTSSFDVDSAKVAQRESDKLEIEQFNIQLHGQNTPTHIYNITYDQVDFSADWLTATVQLNLNETIDYHDGSPALANVPHTIQLKKSR